MTPKLKPFSNRPGRARCMIFAVFTACAAPAALSEGVVVKSASAEHPVGSVVADGEQLRLTQGQSITVLDKSGVMVERTAGRYTGPTSRESSGFLETAKAMADGPHAKSAIGGTRTGDHDAAEKCAAAGGAKSNDACIARDPASRRLRVTAYTPARGSKPAQLTLRSSFEGVTVCTAWNGSQDAVFLPGADPEHPLLLTASQPNRLTAPKSGSKVTPKSLVGLRSVDCAGVSIETWRTLEVAASTALTPNTAAVILSAFARMHGDTAAEARFTAKTLKSAARKTARAKPKSK